MKKIILSAVFTFVVLQLTGCSSGWQIRADQNMFIKNPIKKIALIGTSTVVWPRRGGQDPAIGLLSSKAGIEKIMPMFKTHLETKGYTVTFAEPIAAGMPFKSLKTHPIFEDYENKGDASKLPDLSGNDPAFVYAISNKKIQQSAIALAFELSDAMSDRESSTYHPSQSHIQAILAATDSDTVCQIRAAGWRYSSGRAAGAFFLALLTGSMANTSDGGALGVICSDKTGKVLWQDYRNIDDDPMDANIEHITTTLKYLPHVNTPLPKTCVAEEKNKELYRCEI